MGLPDRPDHYKCNDSIENVLLLTSECVRQTQELRVQKLTVYTI